jgi:hypothetical protein
MKIQGFLFAPKICTVSGAIQGKELELRIAAKKIEIFLKLDQLLN